MAYIRYVAPDTVQREVQRWNIECSGEDLPYCGEERVRKLGRRERREGERGERGRGKEGGRRGEREREEGEVEERE